MIASHATRVSAKAIVLITSEVCSVDQSYESFPVYAVSIEEYEQSQQRALFRTLGKKQL